MKAIEVHTGWFWNGKLQTTQRV